MKFYECKDCGKVIVTNEAVNVAAWRELVAGEKDAAKEKHVPVYAVKCGKVRVSVGEVGHPMTAEHYISIVAIETDQGYQVKTLQPDTLPEVVFSLSAGEKVLGVYAYCNLHGLWKA
ncbi:MAG: desulfoferrodoxin Dfx [Clostridia bacterium]|nr:desulfoferrodoxin Dfx [Clostridia bacterium]